MVTSEGTARRKLGVAELFAASRKKFEENWRSCRLYIGPTSIGFHLPERAETGSRMASYACIDTEPGKIRIVFYGRTVDLCPDGFNQVKQAIPFETYRGPSDTEGTYAELIFPLDTNGWDTHKDRLTC